MSFMNLAKSGFQKVTNKGRLIGTAKNSGIKVFEKVEADGKRILTSFDKQGNMIKKVTREWSTSDIVETKTENFITGAKTDSYMVKYLEGDIVYKFNKTTPVDQCKNGIYEMYKMRRTMLSSDIKSKSLKDLRKKNPEIFHSKDNIYEVGVYQRAADGSTLDIACYPNRKTLFGVKTAGDYRITNYFVLPDGKSTTTASPEGVLSHNSVTNVHELNVLQTLYDGLKKLWS